MTKNNLNFLKLVVIDPINSYSKAIVATLKIIFKEVVFIDNLTYAEKFILEFEPDVVLCDTFDINFKSLKLLNKIINLNSKIPIIVSSSVQNENILLSCIKLQVADFLLKPIKQEELIYSLNKMAKKYTFSHKELVVLNKNLKYDFTKRLVIKNDENIKLTKNESKFLELLISKKNNPVSRQDIELHIWNDVGIKESTFKSLIKRLRDKIGKDYIKNSSNLGYFIN